MRRKKVERRDNEPSCSERLHRLLAGEISDYDLVLLAFCRILSPAQAPLV